MKKNDFIFPIDLDNPDKCVRYEEVDLFVPDKFNVIYADPPWSFNNKKTGGSMKSGSSDHYDVMSLEGLKNLDVNSLANEDSWLFMWWVASQPNEALALVEAWGFTLKTMTAFTWVKTTKHNKLHFGMGFTTRQGAESCLVAVKGKPKRQDAGVRQVFMSENRKHSQKPDEVRDYIDRIAGEGNKLEMFSRREAEGEWFTYGLECPSSIQIPYKHG